MLNIDINSIETRVENDNSQQERVEELNKYEDLGTFKTVKNLKEAYESLRKVFTKNAMELAKLKNDNRESDKAVTPDNGVDKVQTPTEDAKSDWNASVSQFFAENENARKYSKEIGYALVQDKELKNDKSPLQKAWIKVLEQKIMDNAINNEDLEKIVMSNDMLKQKIIQEYLGKLNQKKSSPTIIDSKMCFDAFGATGAQGVFSMEDAKIKAKQFFE